MTSGFVNDASRVFGFGYFSCPFIYDNNVSIEDKTNTFRTSTTTVIYLCYVKPRSYCHPLPSPFAVPILLPDKARRNSPHNNSTRYRVPIMPSASEHTRSEYVRRRRTRTQKYPRTARLPVRSRGAHLFTQQQQQPHRWRNSPRRRENIRKKAQAQACTTTQKRSLNGNANWHGVREGEWGWNSTYSNTHSYQIMKFSRSFRNIYIYISWVCVRAHMLNRP